jgi:hypothetical protein
MINLWCFLEPSWPRWQPSRRTKPELPIALDLIWHFVKGAIKALLVVVAIAAIMRAL